MSFSIGLRRVSLRARAASLLTASALFVSPPVSADAVEAPRNSTNVKERLIGTWTLQSYVETNMDSGEKNHPMGETPSGFIIYTADGYISAQISAQRREPFARNDMFDGSPQEYTAAGRSYLAYSGSYDVDESAGKVFHTIAISLYPNWAGMRQARIVTLDGNTLRLSFERPQLSRGAMRTADLVWVRAPERNGNSDRGEGE